MRSRLVIPCLVLLLATAGGVATFFLQHAMDKPSRTPTTELDESASGDAEHPVLADIEGIKPRRTAELPTLPTSTQRLAELDALLEGTDAVASLAQALSAMESSNESEVRERAFQVAMTLAERTGPESRQSVLRRAINSPFSEISRGGLRACAHAPDEALLDDLLRAAEPGKIERWLAIQALAFLEDPKADEAVLAFARAPDTSRGHRLRAILLLSQTTIPEAMEYLQVLARGDDSELSRHAVEALAAVPHAQRR